jgi:hypothetical protein
MRRRAPRRTWQHLENNSIPIAAQSAPVDSSLQCRNVSETMSQYLSAFVILLMVVSPPLIPALVAVVHKTVAGVRAVANMRKTTPASSVS